MVPRLCSTTLLYEGVLENSVVGCWVGGWVVWRESIFIFVQLPPLKKRIMKAMKGARKKLPPSRLSEFFLCVVCVYFLLLLFLIVAATLNGARRVFGGKVMS